MLISSGERRRRCTRKLPIAKPNNRQWNGDEAVGVVDVETPTCGEIMSSNISVLIASSRRSATFAVGDLPVYFHRLSFRIVEITS
jgi:hypothetical protein